MKTLAMVPVDEEEEDRISKLPDDIIHDILARLRSTNQPAQLTVLSKRWTHLYHSYPILELHDEDFPHLYFPCPTERFVAASTAVEKKFAPQLGSSSNNTLAMESVRVETRFDSFADKLFDLATKNPPREIDFSCYGHKYIIPGKNFFLGPNLQVLKLAYCDFSLYENLNHNPFAGLGNSLKELSLCHVKFPPDWNLNSMIAGASLLESLDLSGNLSTSSLRVLDHPSLKFVTCEGIRGVREIEIIGAPSLEKLVFRATSLDQVLFSLARNNNRRLQVLELKRCDFSLYENPFAGLGSSLKVLSLCHVTFPRDWDLNSMIAGASLLDKLDLCGDLSTSWLRVLDHPSLKVVTCEEIIGVREIEIIGAPSLEKLVFRATSLDHVQVSSTPNLKDLQFDWDVRFTGEKMSELIRGIPSLESLTCYHVEHLSELKLVNSDKLGQVKLWSEVRLIEVDSPRLTNFYYKSYGKWLPTILCKTRRVCEETRGQSFYCQLHYGVDFGELKQFLAELSHVRLTIEFNRGLMLERNDEDEDEDDGLSAKLTVEHVKFGKGFSTSSCDGYLGRLFRICHPKMVSFPQEPEYMSEQLVKRCSSNSCRIGCKCWGRRLKEAKMITTMTSNGGVKEDEEAELVLSSPADQRHISFIMTWH